MEALQSKAEKPGYTVPGISYMAQGGVHWEKDGRVLMNEEPGAKKAKLPTRPNPSGVWIMFDGTPFAHLMVYPDLNKMKEK